MWIAPVPVPLSARFDSNWSNESGNEHFMLQSWGGSGVLHRLGLTAGDHRHRILWQTSAHQATSELFVIACSNRREDIVQAWTWLHDHILSAVDSAAVDPDCKDSAILSRLMDVLPSDDCTVAAAKVEERIAAVFGAVEEDLLAHTKARMLGCTRTGVLALTTCRLVFFASGDDDAAAALQVFHGDIEEASVAGGILFGSTLSIVSKRQERHSFTGLSPATAHHIHSAIVGMKSSSMKSIISSHPAPPPTVPPSGPRLQLSRARTGSGPTECAAFDPVCHYFKLPVSPSLVVCTASAVYFQSRPEQKKEDRIASDHCRVHLFLHWICLRSASLSAAIPVALVSAVSKSAGSLLFKSHLNVVLRFDTDHGQAVLKLVGMAKGLEFHAAIVHCMDYSARPPQAVDEFVDLSECPESMVKPLGRVVGSQSPSLGVAGRLDDELDVAWTDYLYCALGRRQGRAFLLKTEALRTRVWQYGVPDRYRQLVWPLLAGLVDVQVTDVMRDNYRVECSRAEAGVEPAVADEIDKDLRRSLPDHPILRDDRGLAALRRVLLVSSHRNGRHGYTQAMNMLAAVLLIHLPEPLALDVLSRCTTEWLPDTFSQSMLGGAIDQRVFEEALCEHFPTSQMAALVSSGDVAIITFGWFVACFANLLSVECEVRFFDALLLDGPVAIHWFGLSVFNTALQAVAPNDHRDSEPIVLAVNDTFKQMRRNKRLFASVLFQAFSHYAPKFPVEAMLRAKERHSLAALQQLSDRTRAGDLKRLAKTCSVTQDELAVVYDVTVAAIASSPGPGNSLSAFDLAAFKIIARQLVPWLTLFGGSIAGSLFSHFAHGPTMSVDTLLQVVHATSRASSEDQAGLYHAVTGLSGDKDDYVASNKHRFPQATAIKCLY